MLILFFTIIFFSELIIASWLISKINYVRNCVNEINDIVEDFQPEIKSALESLKVVVETSYEKLECLYNVIIDKKADCDKILKNKFLAEVGMFLLNIPYKKILSVIEIFLTIKKILKA